MKSAAFVLLVMGVAGYFLLSPYVEPHLVLRLGDFDRRAQGWEVLRPWAAWPVLAAYGAPVLALAFILGRLVAQTRTADDRQALAKHQAAADARMQEAEDVRREGEAAKQEARAALENAARREQEADARIEAAEFRLQRSVETNIGLRRQIQKLKDNGK